MSSPDNRATANRVLELYDSGVPLFTKEAMRNLADQVAKVTVTGKQGLVYAKNLEGVAVELVVKQPGRKIEEGPGASLQSDDDDNDDDDETRYT